MKRLKVKINFECTHADRKETERELERITILFNDLQSEYMSNLEEKKKTTQEKEIKREEAVDKTKEFKRQRSAEISEDEQESTQGKFITTLGK